MKIFAYILSIFILVLTAIPCADKPQDNTLQKVELSTLPATIQAISTIVLLFVPVSVARQTYTFPVSQLHLLLLGWK